MTGRSLTCPECSRTFRRLSHLQRHISCHNTALHHACQFCEKKFQRSDVARRHAQSCPAKIKDAKIQMKKRGKNPQACDACARSKVSCDRSRPCKRCNIRGSQCSYTNVDLQHLAQTEDSKGQTTLASKREMIQFLMTMANPAQKSSMDAFQPLEQDEHDAQVIIDTVPNGNASIQFDYFNPFSWGFVDPFDNFTLDPWDGSQEVGLDYMLSADNLDGNMVDFQSRLHYLAGELRHLGKDVDEPSYSMFFTPSCFSSLIAAFFRNKQWISPSLVRATFEMHKASLPLVLALAIAGSEIGPAGHLPITTSQTAKSLHDVAETYIFQCLESIKASPSQSSSADIKTIEHCQAALIMTSMQCILNNPETRYRILNRRMPELIATLRKLGWIDTRHDVYPASMIPKWSDFISKETIIRLVTWAFATSNILIIFCNQPPHMTVVEMGGDFPCKEEIWNAKTAEEFETKWKMYADNQCRSSIRDVMTDLTSLNRTKAADDSLASMTIYDLQAVQWAFQSELFSMRCSAYGKAMASTLLRALDEWQRLWDLAVAKLDEQQQRKIGITTHVPAFAWLTRKILDATVTQGSQRSPYLERLGQTDAYHLFMFIKGHMKTE